MDPNEVAQFLKTHPQFFDQHPQLLETIYVPHPHGGRAIPLTERQIVTLREKVRHWRDDHRLTLSDVDCERLAGWLNRTVYHLAAE